MTIEEQAIKLMSESNFKNETHEQFKASLEDKEAFFEQQIEIFERLDCEAKAIASTFYVK